MIEMYITSGSYKAQNPDNPGAPSVGVSASPSTSSRLQCDQSATQYLDTRLYVQCTDNIWTLATCIDTSDLYVQT